jgi:hypothetical protein
MSNSTAAALLAFVIALAGFSGVCLTAPIGYPADSVEENGLIKTIIFGEANPRAFEYVSARLVYQNPSDSPVTFNLTYPIIYSFYMDGAKGDRWGRINQEGEWEPVTVPPHGEYVVTNAGFLPEHGGWYEIEWDGVREGVQVLGSAVTPRIVTDRDSYRVGDGGGTATFEYYNPTQYNVTFNVPSDFMFEVRHPGESRMNGWGIMFEWVFRNVTLTPRSSFRVYSFYFATTKEGELTLLVNDVGKTIQVAPR